MALPPKQPSDASGTDLVPPAADYRLDSRIFDRLFPFHLVLNRDLTVIRCGPVLQRILPSLRLPAALSDHFTIRRPPSAVLDFDRLLEEADRIYLLAALPPSELVLKGQIIPLETEDALAFLGSPWITGLDQLAKLGLTIADFAVHDSVTDFLVLVQAQKTALEDAANLSAQLAEARDAAVQASRAKSEFLATMSHELRTPLNAILGFSEALAGAIFGPLPAKYQVYAGDIHRSGKLLLDLINDLLDLSRIESGQYELTPESVGLAELLEGCLQLIAPEAGAKGLSLALECEPHGISLLADRRALQQTVINLLSNAVKFTHQGSVSLRARLEPGWVVIDVSDTGIGIAPDAIGALFAPFRQAAPEIARRYGGSGLGLSICRRLVALHGGRIALDSRLGQGTTATVRLPASPLL